MTAGVELREDAFDAAAVDLDGISAIEASAGTGKTFTITRLYLRLVVERELPVDRILVVTYTIAATEELRARIRSVLVDARTQLANGRVTDKLLEKLVERAGPEAAFGRLESAVSGFDEAAIFTIHGFCQRVLAEKAFESGMAFKTELLADDGDLLEEIAEDFWRRHFHAASPCLAAHVVAAGESPASLLGAIRDFVGKPYLRAIEPPPAPPAGETEAAFVAVYARARELWRVDRSAIAAAIAEPDRLSKTSYNPDRLRGWLGALDDFFAGPGAPAYLPKDFVKFTRSSLEGATLKRATTPRHAFFDAAEELHQLALQLTATYRAMLKELRSELLSYCREELAARKRRRRVQSFDDLLIDLDQALERDRGGRLCAAIRDRYGAALIDEFQDTDPIQDSIFQRIYSGSSLPVFFVGDPKQAIYSFRGADIFAYIQATGHARRRHRLDRNWRSAPELNAAVNALFAGAARPFLIEEIPFQPTTAANVPQARLIVEGDPPEPFRICVLRRDSSSEGGSSGKPRVIGGRTARDRAARATAFEIARLLNLGAKGRARIGDRALVGGDIAVLVRTNDEARLMRHELLAVKVPSVQQAMQSVFATREAIELDRVLVAVAMPGNESRLKAALATEMIGLSGEDLDRLQRPGGEAAWEEHAERIRAYHRSWRDHGFVRAFRELVAGESVARRLLPYPDGDRRLTNLLHLGELLAEAELRSRLGIESLMRWFADRRQSASVTAEERTEERQLRLESDEDLVKIVTVHKSKGLQYEIVFCPFLWNGKLFAADPSARGKPFRFHDPETSVATLDLGSDQEDALRAHAEREEIAEKIRLLYVALTRARHRCVLFWGAIREAGTSAPAWLLHQARSGEASPVPETVKRRFAEISDAELIADLAPLVERSQGTIGIDQVTGVDTAPYVPGGEPTAALTARLLRRPVPVPFQVASFSAVVARDAHATESALLEAQEAPDYDARAAVTVATESTPERTIFSFPRGVRAGRCLHAMLEDLDFMVAASPDAELRAAALRPAVESRLAAHRLDAAWTDVAIAAVDRVVTSALDAAAEVRLAGLSQDRSVRELEFYYPVEGLDAARLRRVLLEHPVADGRFDREIAALGFSRISGFMKGFIDLVFEIGGRFYVLDYKSNHLGDRIDDYAPERLDAAMARHGYFLQYLIYTVTLHRLLRLRLPGYDPSVHLGGVFYVFLRGLDPGRPPGWSVFHDRPSPALVLALDRLIAGESSLDDPGDDRAQAPRRRRARP